jgi:predicted CoA-binding protein
MPSAYARFWEHKSFVVIGDSATKGFPLLTYRGLKKMGKKVIPIDLGADVVDGDKAFRKIEEIPGPVEAAVLEVPREKTAEILTRVAAAGIRDVWIHQKTDTPQALETARKQGLSVLTGNCAVIYVNPTSFHKVHRWIWRLLGKY